MLRKTPLKPTPFPRRRRAMRRRSPRRIARETYEERAHKVLVHEMGCAAADLVDGIDPCNGELQAAHLGRGGGTSRKAGDQTQTAMLCVGHHDQIDRRNRKGVLAELPADERGAFKLRAIAAARQYVAARTERLLRR